MKANLMLASAVLSLSSLSFAAGNPHPLFGSTTVAGVITDAIVQGGLSDRLSYQGGGSGEGEKALVNKQQGLAPMSRAFKVDAMESAKKAGVNVVDHVIAYDGVAVLVHSNNKVATLSFADLQNLFTCKTTKWEDMPGSGLSGDVKVFVRDEASGTTDTFKSLVGISKFGACVKVVAESDDIANATNTDDNAVGYAGLSAKRDNNRTVAVAKDAGAAGVVPTVATIRAKSYPLSRDLHVYTAEGSFKPSQEEQDLLDKLLDRSFLDPIVQDHGFITLN
jgi:phosphate transport system substrate-binding protein